MIDNKWLQGSSVIDRIEYGYDRAGNRLWRQNVTVSGEDELYGYDGLYQLLNLQRGTLNGTKTAITGTPNWEEEFSLDPSGNWSNYTTLTSGSTTLNQSRAQNTSNEITSLSGSSSLVGYDAIGNMHSTPVPGNWSSAYTLKWDAWNQLVQVKSGSTVVATYGYDGLNRRITQVSALGSFDYYYSKDWQILQENSSGTLLNQFVWGLRGVDDVILRDATSGSSTQRLYALRDVMHVTAITNTSGSVLERYDYDAFGNTRVNGTSSNVSSYGWEIRFCSYLFYQVSGFYQVRNRYLHPLLGRWLSRDPIGENGGINLYAYVGNNPARWKDPFGLKGACTITIYVGEYKRTNKGIGKTKTKNPPDPTNPCGYVGCGANHLNAAQIKRGDGVPDMATNNEEDTDADNDPDLGGSNDFTNSSQVPGQVKSSIEAASKLGNSLCKTCTCSSVKIVVSCDDVAALYVDECESTYNINCK